LRGVKVKSGKSRSVEDLIKQAKPGNPTKGRTTQYEMQGGYDKAVKDFKSLKPSITRDTPELKIGTLKDGRIVNVRSKSSGENPRPTLEIQQPGAKNKIKFRY
jgi:hypothetical protein